MRRIQFILALLLTAIFVVAGPCPACPTPAPEPSSAHDCCPGGKTSKHPAPKTNDCPLIAYYLDVTKAGKSGHELLGALNASPLAMDASAVLTVPVSFEAVLADAPQDGLERYLYLRNTTLLI